MSKLFVVSNRVIQDGAREGGEGGLTTAVWSMLKDLRGSWIGWSGSVSDDESVQLKMASGVAIYTTDMSDRAYEKNYCGFANACLWPLFHERLDLVRYDESDFSSYMDYNRRIAMVLSELAQPEDLIWVHDYHFLPLAQICRDLGMNQRIGFFLHTPFPPPSVISALPNHWQSMKTLLSYSLVGVQSGFDAENLQSYLRQQSDGNKASEPLVAAFPISIDTRGVISSALACTGSSDFGSETKRSSVRIFSADRMDYSKGFINRILAYDQFLSKRSDPCPDIQYCLVAPDSRENISEYRNHKSEVMLLLLEVQQRWRDDYENCIEMINQPVAPEPLLAMMRASQVGFIAPLRDGMNLVAKEYIAAQNPVDPGVLIVSKFCGAGRELPRAGLIAVNPHDISEMARALEEAVVMPRTERVRRHRLLMSHLLEYDVKWWARSYLKSLQAESCLSMSDTSVTV